MTKQHLLITCGDVLLAHSATRLGEFSPFGLLFEGQGDFFWKKISPNNWRIFGLLLEKANFSIFLLHKKF